jgi:hypothetical protein
MRDIEMQELSDRGLWAGALEHSRSRTATPRSEARAARWGLLTAGQGCRNKYGTSQRERPDAVRRLPIQGRPHDRRLRGIGKGLELGRAAFQMPKPKYPKDPIEPAPNPPPPSQVNADASAASLRRHVLPKDLPTAIRQLDDQELDRLLAAVLAEQKRRDRKPTVSTATKDKPRTEAAAVHLTPGKMNAVRAAFKVGVKPSQIARQFGLSQSDVRKALAGR